jgi:hypothetical protein
MVGVANDPITAGSAAALYPSAQIRNEGFEPIRVGAGHLSARIVGRFAVDGSEPEPPRIWYDSTTNFAVTLPPTPADQGEQRRTVTNAYSQVAGMQE